MNSIRPQEIQHDSQETNLVRGNRALRSGDYLEALEAYFTVFTQYPAVFKSLAINIYYIQRQLLKQKEGLSGAPIAICTWRLFSPKTRSRALTLANLYRSSRYTVEMINCIPGGGIHQNSSIEGISLNSLPFLRKDSFLMEMLEFVLNHPYQIIHITSAQLPNLLLGILYKSIWNALVLVDVDHRTVLELGDNFPIVNKFDGITVTDANLQSRYGGWVFSEPADFSYIPEPAKVKISPAAALNSLIEMQFEAVAKILASIISLNDDSPLLQEQTVSQAMSDADELALLERLRNELIQEIKFFEGLGYLSIDSFEAANYLFTPKSNQSFLGNLFSAALGRPAQEHEANHYLGQLERAEITRLGLAEIVFNGPESKTHMREREKGLFVKKTVTLPKIGDIKPELINIPLHKNPLVSVLIPVYGKLEYTLACLDSISKNLPKISFEILVLDDRSPDNSVEQLQKVKNINVVINPENLGFTKSCNYGSKHAKGKFLFFLNNDTQVQPGWLDELHKTFNLFPGTGLAGSKLVYPDGSMQEAGGIIWQDGSAWNYGNKQRPDLPAFNYAREVDYVSGASIMVPADLFKELGMFDERYAPAYCEDADFALAVRSSGYRVIYQPLSVVTHYEGVSSGTDVTSGIKSYQVRNSKFMFEKWRDFLASHRPNGSSSEEEKDRRANKRVLAIEHTTITPNRDAGSVSVFNILLLLREMDFQVTFIPEDNFLYESENTTLLQKSGIEVEYAPFTNSVETHLKQFGNRYDLVLLFRPGVVEKHAECVKKYCGKAKTLFYTHDIHYLRMMREAELLGDEIKLNEAKAMQEREFKAIESMDSTIVVSPAELEILKPQLPDVHFETLPLLLDIPGTHKKYVERSDFVFFGSFVHPPNLDAVKYFASEVMPLVRKSLPGVRFHIVGNKTPDEITAMACEDIVVHGFVEDLGSLLDQMRLSIAPLRFGAGVKGKVGTALAAGLPSILSEIAAEGMGLTHKKNVLIAKDGNEMAQLIFDAYNNESLWSELSLRGIQFASDHFGPTASYNSLSDIIQYLKINVPQKPRYPLSMYGKSFT
jgi:GT2 family glycosyltransferase